MQRSAVGLYPLSLCAWLRLDATVKIKVETDEKPLALQGVSRRVVAKFQRFANRRGNWKANWIHAKTSILLVKLQNPSAEADFNLKITKPDGNNCKVLENKEVSNRHDLAGKPGGKDATKANSERLPCDERLAMLMETWDSLPEAVRVGITALVRASVPTVSPQSGSGNA